MKAVTIAEFVPEQKQLQFREERRGEERGRGKERRGKVGIGRRGERSSVPKRRRLSR